MFSDEELYSQLKDLPYFKHLPLPNKWYDMFNIPKPEPVSFQDYALGRNWLAHKFDENITYEVKTEPAPGGVRPIIESEPISLEIEVKDQTSAENLSQTPVELACSTKSTETENQQLLDSPSSQSSYA